MMTDEASWIRTINIESVGLVQKLSEDLDLGEAEAISLALEVKADFLIMDELKGRKFAKEYGLRIIGILGILILAKDQNLILEVRPIMDVLRNDVGFRMSDKIYQFVLQQVGEE